MYSGIIPIIKQAAIDAVESTHPVAVLFGKVIKEDPVEIQVTPKLVLKEKHLIIPDSLTKKTFKKELVEIKGKTRSAEDHSHTINDNFEVILDNRLKVGEYAILLRLTGGNQYLILDRVVK